MPDHSLSDLGPAEDAPHRSELEALERDYARRPAPAVSRAGADPWAVAVELDAVRDREVAAVTSGYAEAMAAIDRITAESGINLDDYR